MQTEGHATGSPGALAGVRVVDLTRVLGGPYATQILADHGADVVKIEPPQGDEVRDWGPPFRDGTASYFVGINRFDAINADFVALPTGTQPGITVENGQFFDSSWAFSFGPTGGVLVGVSLTAVRATRSLTGFLVIRKICGHGSAPQRKRSFG